MKRAGFARLWGNENSANQTATTELLRSGNIHLRPLKSKFEKLKHVFKLTLCRKYLYMFGFGVSM